MKSLRTDLIGWVAYIMVWLEDLAIAINARRFLIESKRARSRHTETCVDIYETKIINDRGYVIATLKDIRPK